MMASVEDQREIGDFLERGGVSSSKAKLKMPKRKIQIKRIEDYNTRQVTFCKRRGGLLKKACELSVLCDAEIALLVISPRGRTYEYASNNMNSTIEKYKEQTTTAVESIICSREKIDDQFYQMEAKKLRKKIYTSQMSNEHLKGEGLGSLGRKELTQLETKVEKAISRIRCKKHELILEETELLKKREIELEQNNAILRMKIAENERLQHEIDEVGYHAIESYLARSSLQLNIMAPFEATTAPPNSTLSPTKSLRIWYD